MPDELLQRLQRFQTDAFPQHRSHFRLRSTMVSTR
jgi:carbonic anhydrase